MLFLASIYLRAVWGPQASLPTLLETSKQLVWERAIHHPVSSHTLYSRYCGSVGPLPSYRLHVSSGILHQGNGLSALSLLQGVVPNSQVILLLCFKNQAYVPGTEVSFPAIHRRTDRWCTVKKITKPAIQYFKVQFWPFFCFSFLNSWQPSQAVQERQRYSEQCRKGPSAP